MRSCAWTPAGRANRPASRSPARIRKRWTSTTRSNGLRSGRGCSGNIGTLGISYHAASQWRLANLQPPSLKTILPWEGRADQYRDQVYHGSIFAMVFMSNWHTTQTAQHLLGKSRSYNLDAFHYA